MSYVRAFTLGDLFAAAFTLYRRYFWKLLAINAIFVLVSLADALIDFQGAFLNLGSGLLYWVEAVAQMIVTAAICVAVSNAILDRPVKVWGSFRRAFSPGYLLELLALALPAFLLALLNGPFLQTTQDLIFQVQAGRASAVQVFLSGILLFLVMAALRTCLEIALLFGPPVVVLEKRSLPGTVSRMFALFRSNWRRVLVNYGVFWLLPIIALRLALFIPIALALSMAALSRVGFSVDSIYQVSLAVGVPTIIIVNGVISLFLNPITALLYTLLYYDTRARKENYTQELLAESLGYGTLSEMMTV